MRGAQFRHECKHFVGRIIPADAGSTDRIDIRLSEDADHPRGCGEHSGRASRVTVIRGSSPRMRGAQVHRVVGFRVKGIIPADAGSTEIRTSYPRAFQDHPRGCGEHATPPGRVASCQGSSPRMRGAQHGPSRLQSGPGIIPADAGSTKVLTLRRNSRRDHPRGCGEHVSTISRLAAERGSSPRMRGARYRSRAVPDLAGIIPADAGSTEYGGAPGSRRRDHPRGCGEHLISS